MENKIKLPLAFIGGSTLGFLASPLSMSIVNKALIKGLKTKVENFKKSLSSTQNSIYLKLEQRVSDVENFEEKSKEREDIQNEILSLREELLSTLSPKQTESFNNLEVIEDKLYKKLKKTRNATMAVGGLLGIALTALKK